MNASGTSDSNAKPTTAPEHSNFVQKAAALFEVVGIFILGNAAASWLESLMGLKPLGALEQSALNNAQVDFISLSIGWLQIMSVQYVCLLFPAFAICTWRRHSGLRYYGITKAGKPMGALVFLGLLAFTFVALPFKLLWVAKHFLPAEPRPLFWSLLERSWTPTFWLFLAVSSFVLTPIFEELFFRGYCQTRLEEDFGGIGAISIMTLFMTLGHNQYFHLNLLNAGTIITLIPITLGLGYVYWYSRSLIPAVILHMAINIPTKDVYDFLLPVMMVLILIVFRRKWLGMVYDFWQEMVRKGWKAAAFVAATLACIVAIGFEIWPRTFVLIACPGLAIALFVEFQKRHLENGSTRA